MGAGIAQVSLNKGFHTILKDSFEAGLARGQEQLYKGFDTQAKRKKITTCVSEYPSYTEIGYRSIIRFKTVQHATTDGIPNPLNSIGYFQSRQTVF